MRTKIVCGGRLMVFGYRVSSIHKKFFIFEVITTLLIVSFGAGLEYNHIGVELDQKIGIEILLFLIICDTIFILILAGSAIYLARSMKKIIGSEIKVCLVTWHICNLLCFLAILVLAAVLDVKEKFTIEDSEDHWKYFYFYTLAKITAYFVGIYMDLFLLWLLYKFMKVQITMRDTEEALNPLETSTTSRSTSVSLFAHDATSAATSLLNSFKEDREIKKA